MEPASNKVLPVAKLYPVLQFKRFLATQERIEAECANIRAGFINAAEAAYEAAKTLSLKDIVVSMGPATGDEASHVVTDQGETGAQLALGRRCRQRQGSQLACLFFSAHRSRASTCSRTRKAVSEVS
jgi:hypothetical protein